ncbi:hypothetical protein CKO23_07820 [Thiocystis violacea]|nr:hypothetical protein [Thiocystis violacea]
MGLDPPVPTVKAEQTRGVGAVGGVIGDTVDRLDGDLAGLLLNGVSLNGEDLTDLGEVEIGVEGRGGPNGTAFDAPVLEGEWFTKIRLAAVGEVQADIGGQRRLVILGGEEVVRTTFDQIVGENGSRKSGSPRSAKCRRISAGSVGWLSLAVKR